MLWPGDARLHGEADDFSLVTGKVFAPPKPGMQIPDLELLGADICYLLLFAPSLFFDESSEFPSSSHFSGTDALLGLGLLT